MNAPLLEPVLALVLAVRVLVVSVVVVLVVVVAVVVVVAMVMVIAVASGIPVAYQWHTSGIPVANPVANSSPLYKSQKTRVPTMNRN